MASTESTSSTSNSASQPPAQDVQTLIGLLNGLMPLLQRAQSASQAGASWSPNLMFTNPVLEHRAAVNLIENITTESLRGLSAYLDAHAEHYPALENGRPIIAKAEQCRVAGDYAQAFNLIFECYRAITQLRAVSPQMPALQPGAGPEMSFSKTHPSKSTSPPH